MNNDNPFLQYSDMLENRQRVRAVLLDFFPNEKVKANVLVIAYDSGIALAIRNSNMYVPKWESIQRIEVKATLDPAMLW